jgi:hypothetical protein
VLKKLIAAENKKPGCKAKPGMHAALAVFV